MCDRDLRRGRLFECWLGDDGDPCLEEIDAGLLDWGDPLLGLHSFVRVLRSSSVAAFASQVKQDATPFLAACRSALVP